jgi:urea transporter
MTGDTNTQVRATSWPAVEVRDNVRLVFRSLGQVFFQENALSGFLFAIGIAMSSPLMALGAVVGSAIGRATAWILKFDGSVLKAGIYGINPAVIGIATLFFFPLGVVSSCLMVVGCVVAALLTEAFRRYVPFMTYATPFNLTFWPIYFLGPALGAPRIEFAEPVTASFVEAVAFGIGQVLFQASIWTTLFFLAGMALNNWRHACWAVVASLVGMLVGIYHHDSSAEVAALGLYGYNAVLAALALSVWRPSVLAPFLGILLSVPLTENFPLLGLPALTAPFVLSTWLVQALVLLEGRLFGPRAPSPS